MARKRFVDPSFWTDISVGKLSLRERLLFLGCVSNADDEGRLPGNPAYLRSTIFPYDDLSLSDVQAMRDAIASLCKNFAVYTVGEDEYIAFRKWRKYQSPRYPQPSNYPAPPWEQDGDAAVEEQRQPLMQDCNQKDATLPQDNINDVTMGSGSIRDQVRDQDQVGDVVSSQDDLPPDATLCERSILHELKQVPKYPLDVAKDLGHVRTISVDFPLIDVLEEAKRWRAWLMDHPLKETSNPRLQFRNWCSKAASWQKERRPANGTAGKHVGKHPGTDSRTATDGDKRPTEKDYRSGKYGWFFDQQRVRAASKNLEGLPKGDAGPTHPGVPDNPE